MGRLGADAVHGAYGVLIFASSPAGGEGRFPRRRDGRFLMVCESQTARVPEGRGWASASAGRGGGSRRGTL